jgi:fructan beta-fructosidase
VIRLFVLLFAILQVSAETFHEPYRPQFHFTPAKNWMNDPNGMVYFDGEYHLFYQYNPFGNKWGHMSWGHAVSRDLVHWEHLPVALQEENDVMIFSGSAAVDWNNTSGFGKDGKPPLIAIYTGHYTKKPLQNQHIAYSNDRGRTWTKYAGNPVLDLGEKDFRDPKVMWHEGTKRWIMTVAWPIQRKVRFYASDNLTSWTHLSDFGPEGSVTGIWECPDLFPLNGLWVLIVNVGSGGPAGGSSAGQYFIGDFDGNEFKLDSSFPKSGALWLDSGPDYYAAVTWSDVPKRRLSIGWMSNWQYAGDIPTSPWRSAMSLPRELVLANNDNGVRLVQQPVKELQRLRGESFRLKKATIPEVNRWIEKNGIPGDQLEIEISAEAGEFGVEVLKSGLESTRITSERDGKLTIDRTRSGKIDFHRQFSGRYSAHPRGRNLRIFVDACSVEVFANDGEAVMTALTFPGGKGRALDFFGDEGLKIERLDVWKLKSIYEK